MERSALQHPFTRPTFIVQLEGRSKSGNSGTPTHRSQGKKSNRGNDQTKKKAPPQAKINFGLAPHLFYGTGTQGKSRSSDPGSGRGRGRGSGDGYDIANGMGLEQEGKLYPFFDALWRRVDAVTTYPNDFVQQRIKGQVVVQMVVDRRGVFTGQIRAVNGSEPMLNAFVLATLVHALRNPLPENSWMQGDEPQASNSMLLVFQFDFDLFGPGGHPKPNKLSHLKNILGFRRDAYVDPALNQAIEKLFSRYIPAIIPIPGGFFIDFIRLYQFVKNIAAPTPDEDEMRMKRLEIKKEEWESLIQKNGGE